MRLRQEGNPPRLAPCPSWCWIGRQEGDKDEERRIGFEYECLVPSLTDAEEPVAVLRYLVRQAEASA